MEVGGRGGNTQRKANKTLFLPLERPESGGDITCGGLELVRLRDDAGPGHRPTEPHERTGQRSPVTARAGRDDNANDRCRLTPQSRWARGGSYLALCDRDTCMSQSQPESDELKRGTGK